MLEGPNERLPAPMRAIFMALASFVRAARLHEIGADFPRTQAEGHRAIVEGNGTDRILDDVRQPHGPGTLDVQARTGDVSAGSFGDAQNHVIGGGLGGLHGRDEGRTGVL
mgnify:CR=1 FL=1